MQDLQNELRKYRDKLDLTIKELKARGQNKARCECDYRIELAKEMLMQRSEGMPVTIISDIVRGKKEIATLKMQRDIAETLYESCLQAIYSTKLQMQLLQSQIEAERKGE